MDYIQPDGNAGNVNYLQAALAEKISHANLFRRLLMPPGRPAPKPDHAPNQVFYFPTGVFDTIEPFF